MERTLQSEPFDCLPTSIILTTSCSAELNTRLVVNLIVPQEALESGVHAVVHIDHFFTTSNVGNSTSVTASNKDNLHKFSSQNLEGETLVNCRILQASYVWEFLQDELLSSLNDGV